MILDFHRNFKKAYLKLSGKLQSVVDEKLKLFLVDPFARELNNHALSGKYQGHRSINISGDYRAIYRESSEDTVIFVQMGTHAQLYG